MEITEVAYGGDGVGRVDGRVWFIPFTLPGERIRARSVKASKQFVRAEILAIENPSPERIPPACPLFTQCGGCRYQHAAYPWQLRTKQEQVIALLARVGGFRDRDGAPLRSLVAPIVAAPEPYRYRNRITVHIREGIVGFHRADGRGLIDVPVCHLAQPAVQEKLTAFRAGQPFDGHRTLRAYDEVAGFRQTHDAVAALLRDFVTEKLTGASGVFLDVYGGSGFFARAVSAQFAQVFLIDWSSGAARVARRDAPAHWTLVEAEAAEGLRAVRERLQEQAPPLSGAPEIHLLVDPPAVGLDRAVIEELMEWNLAQLLYVSCDPATFARDAARLAPRYRLEAVQPFDMFPQTADIEVVGCFVSK